MSKYVQSWLHDLSLLPPQLKVAFVVAEWNKSYTQSLAELNSNLISELWFAAPTVYRVPGSLELPGFANQLLSSGQYDVVVIFGVIIKGKTMHYEFISQAIFQGVMNISLAYPQKVIISGVLTVEDEALLAERVTDNYARAALNLYSEKQKVWL